MICEKKQCTGCYGCYNICPKDAISMLEDEYGSIFPIINEEKCINCDLCKKVCPAINKVQFRDILKCYAMQRKDDKLLAQSTSGGASAIMAEKVIEQNGVVYGCSFKKGFKIEHIRISDKVELDKIKTSKYVHSYIEKSYKNVKKDLKDGLKVLFTGTPCQVAGLKKFLGKDAEHKNLYCTDLICHGVPSQKILKEELEKEIDINNIDELKFRDSNKFKIIAKKENTIIYEKESQESKFYISFLKSELYRENCYECMYAQPNRVSDITIGDFWGIKEDSKFYKDKEKGLSVLLPCTEKGMELVSLISDECNLEERNIDEAIKGNTQLRQPSTKHKKYDKLRRLYKKYGFEKAYDKTFKLRKIRTILKRNKFMVKIYTTIKGSN